MQIGAQEGKGLPGGPTVDFLRMPSSCPERMLALPPVLHLTYPVGRAHEDKSHTPGAVVQVPAGSQYGNRPPAQPSDSRETGQRFTPNVEGSRALCIKRDTIKSDSPGSWHHSLT